MLELRNIVKVYETGGTSVTALKGIDLAFRKNEFVSILGQSGCGKTTLLNIIGGLDQYTSGDLIINGKSTKSFRDGDWDVYRNRAIGFVFQSYNLIPHQTVLRNVELAMTLSGVSKSERHRRAVEALEKVGLGDQLKKKPNQMSGGQMQRVAIARALVNNPDIILADEPTGALDTETSVQVMEILKEVAKDRLVIMVTHNPELAQRYSTRIVRLLDGKVTDDSDPYDGEPDTPAAPDKIKKKSMSFRTATSLSLNNLMTKKARTCLTAFAGSIGIIGIALILSISTGVNDYIGQVQQDTLASYPISIEKETVDMSGLLSAMGSVQQSDEDTEERDRVYSNPVMYDLINSMNSMTSEENNLAPFKEYIEKELNSEDSETELKNYVSAIQYTYDLDMDIYTEDPDGKIIKSDVSALMSSMLSGFLGASDDSASAGVSTVMSSTASGFYDIDIWEEMLSGTDGNLISGLVKDEYQVLYGEWPQSYDQVVLIVNGENEISDLCLYALGLKSSDEMLSVMEAAMNGEMIDTEAQSWSYEDICGKTFRLVLPADRYQLNEGTGTYSDISDTDAGMRYLYDNGLELKITGIVRVSEDAVSGMMSGAIGYTSALTDYIIGQNGNSAIAAAQLQDPDTDVFTGLPFMSGDSQEPTSEEKSLQAANYLSVLSGAEKAAAYTELMSEPTEEYVNAAVEQAMGSMTRQELEASMTESYSAETGMEQETVKAYLADMDDETLFAYAREAMTQSVREQYAGQVAQQLGSMTTDQLAAALDAGMADFTQEQLAAYYDNYMPRNVSDATYEDNLKKLGCVDKSDPDGINIYAATFEDKDSIADIIEDYNRQASDADKISYTDYVALLMSSVTTIINAISYVLIAFVAISLVVSSIMIGIITYISVLERTKEIGILRAMGASKKDISRVFNAETLIVGFCAGAIGIIVTVLLCIPANIIIHSLTGINSLNAVLPWAAGLILVLISMFLTFIAGLIPSKLAAKKDPVVALRTE